MARIVKGAWMNLEAPIKRRPKVPADAVFQIKVVLKSSKPPIWRRLQVRGDTTLGQLHAILQTTMGWGNSHVHTFEVGDVLYASIVSTVKIDDAKDEELAVLKKVAPKIKAKIKYEYDLGDGWAHEVVVEKILPGEPGQKVPVCVAGEGACPPEDCGGLWGYYAMLDTLADPKHPEHGAMKKWVSDDFNPDAFDVDKANSGLKKFQKK